MQLSMQLSAICTCISCEKKANITPGHEVMIPIATNRTIDLIQSLYYYKIREVTAQGFHFIKSKKPLPP